jgi:hypothetical protein
MPTDQCLRLMQVPGVRISYLLGRLLNMIGIGPLALEDREVRDAP